jgi:hypothetical protein
VERTVFGVPSAIFPKSAISNQQSEMNHVITFHPNGHATTLYTDRIDLRQLGQLNVKRASSVEFNNATGEWEVRWLPSVNPEAGRYVPIPKEPPVFTHKSREECLRWEHEQMNQ